MTSKIINGLTSDQRRKIFKLANNNPANRLLIPHMYYQPSFILSWYITIEWQWPSGGWHYEQITRCDNEQSARRKFAAIQAFLMKPKG